MLGAIRFGFEACQDMVALQDEIVAAVGKPKIEFEPVNASSAVAEAVSQRAADKIGKILCRRASGPSVMPR